MTSPILQVRGLSVSFPRTSNRPPAVSGFDLDLEAGSTVGLVGESGSGKSTVALAVMGLLPPGSSVQGSITLEGRNLVGLPAHEMRRLRGRVASMIFQEPMVSLNPVHTVGAQIAEVLREHTGLSRKASWLRAVELLDQVKISEPDVRARSYPHELSGGQRQRVMIAMAIACKPRLLIADEPTTALDATIQSQILELLDTLRKELSLTLLLITHDLGVVAQYADQVIVMHGGRLVERGTASQIFRAPSHPYTRGLLGASLHGGSDVHYRTATLPEIHSAPTNGDGGRTYDVRVPAHTALPPVAHETALAVDNVSVVYGEGRRAARAVESASFDLSAGETLGVVGESGCGKSSLAKAIMCLIPIAAGEVRLAGIPISDRARRGARSWRKSIRMIFQDAYGSLNPRWTIGDVLAGTLQLHGQHDSVQIDRTVRHMLNDVGLPSDAAARYPHEFSGGQRQRIGIARALITRPSVVICDESVSALDVSVRAQILNLLNDLKRELSLSYLFISHDLSVVRYMSDRVLVMSKGRIVEQGDHKAIWTTPRHPYTRELLSAVSGRINRSHVDAAIQRDNTYA